MDELDNHEPLRELRDRYLAAQLRGDRRGALRVITDEGSAAGLDAAALHHVIGEAQREIGRLWQEDRISVAEEHAATAISQMALTFVYQQAARRAANGKKVLELPLVAGHEDAQDAPMRMSEPPPDVGSGARRILLVEDNDDAREGLAALWEVWGHRVFAAADGLEGIRIASAEPLDVAFVDIGLPELDGYEVAERLRAREETRDLLLIALTGYGAKEQRARAIQAGFDHHMVKPVEPERVKELLADLRAARRTSQRATHGDR